MPNQDDHVDIQPNLARLLAATHPKYDADEHLVWHPVYSIGYHTQLEKNQPAHPTRESANYAYALLAAGEKERADKVLQKLCLLQDKDTKSDTCGVWPWFLEEPLTDMSPPDWNWADFIGSIFALILHNFQDQLSPVVVKQIKLSLIHAADAIVHRNVQPDYTNIAIMGAGVTVAVGEIVDRSDLIDYGRRRIQKSVAHLKHHGSFSEYNSPSYTMIVVEECERILHMVKDEDTRASASRLLEHAWEIISNHFHPSTRQWAGPHSRAYSDTISPELQARLSVRTGYTLTDSGISVEDVLPFEYAPPIICPEHLRHRFVHLPIRKSLLSQQFVAAGPTKYKPTIGNTWFDDDICLSSISDDSMWIQRHGIIAYIRSDRGLAVFRTRFMHDGHDFATAWLTCRQDGPCVYATIRMIGPLGDYHLSLDRPKNGFFQGGGWQIRLELQGSGVMVNKEDRRLLAPPCSIDIQEAKGTFAGKEVLWKFKEKEGLVAMVGHVPEFDNQGLSFNQLESTHIQIQLTANSSDSEHTKDAIDRE